MSTLNEVDCPDGAGCELHPMGHYRGRGIESIAAPEVHAAVDTFIGAYNDARSERRGYHYVSGYLITSDPDLGEAVRVLLAPLRREVERLAEDSQTLNKIVWAIAGALGEIPPGAVIIEADPVELAKRLIGTLERRTVQLDNARADADAARAEVERLRDKADVSGHQGDIS